MELSLVIPIYNEADNILPLIKEIQDALDNKHCYEIIMVNDASTDGSNDVLNSLQSSNLDHLRIKNMLKNSGQSASINVGVESAKYEWVVTLDGDGQNDPEDIIPMLDHLESKANENKGLLISGVRLKRNDSVIKKLSSRLANNIRRTVLQDGAIDTGCGIKVFNRDYFLRLPRFKNMHRFMPALYNYMGGSVEFVGVNHRERSAGESKYGTIDRALAGIFDLAGMYWLRKRQMHLQYKDA